MEDLWIEKRGVKKEQSKEREVRCGSDSGMEINRMDESLSANDSRFGHCRSSWKNKSTYSCVKLAATSSAWDE